MTESQKRQLNNTTILENALMPLTEHGYKCFMVANSGYGYVVTPNNNTLCVAVGGLSKEIAVSIEWKRSKENGTSGRCLEVDPSNLTLETMEKAEAEGLRFARECNAPLYSTPDEFFNSYWEKDKLRVISSNENRGEADRTNFRNLPIRDRLAVAKQACDRINAETAQAKAQDKGIATPNKIPDIEDMSDGR